MWILHLPERMDHEQRLMPYLLSALDDESPQIQVRIRGWVMRPDAPHRLDPSDMSPQFQVWIQDVYLDPASEHRSIPH